MSFCFFGRGGFVVVGGDGVSISVVPGAIMTMSHDYRKLVVSTEVSPKRVFVSPARFGVCLFFFDWTLAT